MKSLEQTENEFLNRVAFMARYEASTLGAGQVEWPHLFLGLMREGRSLVQNFVGSHQAVVGLSLKIRETMPVRPKVSTGIRIPMAADCQSFLTYAAQQVSGERRPEAALEVLFVSLLKNQPDWFRQYGFDSEVVASALSYPTLNPPAVKSMQLTGVPAVMLEFRGVLDEMETALRPMPEARANEPITPGAAWSRKQFIGFLIDSASNQHQLWYPDTGQSGPRRFIPRLRSGGMGQRGGLPGYVVEGADGSVHHVPSASIRSV
jgi:hypothetical protein